MEKYNEFLDRINSFEKNKFVLCDNNFLPNLSVLKKVNANNCFSCFYGDTVVFELSHQDKIKISKIVDKLYQSVPECFCEKLVSDTFHMTLHDLSNSPVLDKVESKMSENKAKLVSKINKVPVADLKIKMKTNNIFNMVNTSLVLGLYPANAAEYEKLMSLYEYVDDIMNLSYPFTPHITLAYYNRNGFLHSSVLYLEKLVNKLNEQSFNIEISTEKLVYQNFMSMNEYKNIFNLA